MVEISQLCEGGLNDFCRVSASLVGVFIVSPTIAAHGEQIQTGLHPEKETRSIDRFEAFPRIVFKYAD